LKGKSEKFISKIIGQIERAFPSPEPDKHRYIIETDKFSYILLDSRPREDGSGNWTKTPIAKFSYNEMDKMWQLSWMPPQGRWQKYGKYYDIETAALVIKGDPTGCFMGQVSPLAYLKSSKKITGEEGGDG